MGHRTWTAINPKLLEDIASRDIEDDKFLLLDSDVVNMARELLLYRQTLLPITDKIRTPANPPELSAKTMEEAANYRWLHEQPWFRVSVQLNLSDSRLPRSYHNDIGAARRKKD